MRSTYPGWCQKDSQPQRGCITRIRRGVYASFNPFRVGAFLAPIPSVGDCIANAGLSDPTPLGLIVVGELPCCAGQIREKTTVSLSWIAQKLHMRSAANVSLLLARARSTKRDENPGQLMSPRRDRILSQTLSSRSHFPGVSTR